MGNFCKLFAAYRQVRDSAAFLYQIAGNLLLLPTPDQSLCWSLEYSMIVKLLTEYHLEFLSLKGGCRGLSESIIFKMSNCWKSHAAAH